MVSKLPDPPRVDRKRVRSRKTGEIVTYHYAWRGGPQFWNSQLDIAEGSAAYWSRYRAALKTDPNPAGTFRAVLRAFLASPKFQRLSDRTREDYAYSIRRPGGIDEKWGSAPLALFDSPEIRRQVYRWRDRVFQSDRQADMVCGHLAAIVSWAVDRGEIGTNHLLRMDRRYSVDRSALRWSDMEIDAFLTGRVGEIELLPPADDITARILLFATETGLRPVDQIRVTRGNLATLSGRRILQIIPTKTSRYRTQVSIPVTPVLARIIDTTPKSQLTILAGPDGRPYSDPKSLSQRITRRRDALAAAAAALGLENPVRDELNFYDTRSTACDRLYAAGATIAEIAAAMGWTPQTAAQMIATYAAAEGAHVIGLFDKLQRRSE